MGQNIWCGMFFTKEYRMEQENEMDDLDLQLMYKVLNNYQKIYLFCGSPYHNNGQ